MDETLPIAGPGPADSARRRRLLFRANHRGTRENDLLIGGFVSARIGDFTEDEIAALETILDLPDPLIGDYLTGRGPMPDACDERLLAAMRAATPSLSSL